VINSAIPLTIPRTVGRWDAPHAMARQWYAATGSRDRACGSRGHGNDRIREAAA